MSGGWQNEGFLSTFKENVANADWKQIGMDFLFGKDDPNLQIATVENNPITSLLGGGGGSIKGLKYLLKGAKGGLTNPQLLQKSATLAERAIGGTGGVAGTAKHVYAKNLLSRYQSRFGGDLSLGSNYFNKGVGNRGFLDVVNHNTKTIYDFKFGNAIMSNSQFLKYSRNFEGYGIQIIKP